MAGGSGGSKVYLPSFSLQYNSKYYKDNWDSVFGEPERGTECPCGAREKTPDQDCKHWRCAKCWQVLGPI